MQEAQYRQVKDFAAGLSAYDWIGLGREGGSRGEFMAVFYRTERLEPLAFDHFWLSDTPEVINSSTWGNSNRRMVTWVKFRDRATDQEFIFVNTHFDHQIEAARVKSAELVVKRLGDYEPELPLLLVGDFNAIAGASEPYRILIQGGFADSWDAAEQRGELFNTFHGFRGGKRGENRIDWILTRGAVKTLRTEIVTFEHNEQYPSDHYPVLADVVLGEQ